MITYLSGTLVSKSPAEAVVDVGGMGYHVQIPMSSFEKLPEAGEATRLLTHFHVREDAQTLFGFATESERTLFRTMIGVSGVGPRLALAALSAFPPDALRDHLLAGDTGVLTRIPGVGKKTAERMIVELRDRIADDDHIPGHETRTGDTGARQDARSALESLGLSRSEAEKRIRSVLKESDGPLTAEVLIRRSLQG